MSSLIQPYQPPSSTSMARPVAPAGSTRAAVSQACTPIESEAPVSLDALPSVPPPEVIAQIETAGATYESLRAQGYEVHYSYDEQSRRTNAELRDASGNVVKTLSPAEAVDLAMGGAVGESKP